MERNIYVGIARLEVHIEDAHSLKEKRSATRPLVERIRNRHQVHVPGIEAGANASGRWLFPNCAFPHAGQVIYPPTQDRLWAFFILISRGSLHVDTPLRRTRQQTHIISPGDYFGEEALLEGSNPNSRITALEASELITLTPANFNRLLTDFPDIKLALKATMDSRRLVRSHPFSWLSPDEAIYFITRKHYFFLFRSLFIAILFLVISIPLLTIGLAEATGGESLSCVTGLLHWKSQSRAATSKRLSRYGRRPRNS